VESAWIVEIEDEDDPSRLTGRFRVSLRSEAGDTRRAGTFALAEAVRYGRERAARVYVDVNDVRYTAGADRDAEYPRWPETTDARPRPLATPLDGSVQTVPWLIQGRIRTDDAATPADAASLAAHVEACLHAADDAQRPAVTVRAHGTLYAELEVVDRGAGPARRRAAALLDRIVRPTGDGTVDLVAWTSSPDVLRRYIR
jgi:hypothetical protein